MMYILALENRLGARPIVCHNFKPPLQNLLHSLPRNRVETLHSHNEGCGAAVSPARAASPRPLAARALTSLRALTGRMRPDARRCMQRTRGSWLKTSHAQAGGNPNPNHNPNPNPRYLVAITWSILAAQGGITLEQPTHMLQTFTVMCTMVVGLLVDAVLIGSIAQVLADQNAKQRAKVGPGTRAGA